MNIFRFIADMLHLAAILTLLYRIKVVRNCIGKSQHYPSHLHQLLPQLAQLSAQCLTKKLGREEVSCQFSKWI